MVVFLSDTMTDTDGVLLENHTPEVGGAWQLRRSTASTIQSNKCQAKAGASSDNQYTNTAVPGGAEYDITCVYDPVGASGRGELIARYLDDSNLYFCGHRADAGVSSKLRLYKRVAGVYTLLDYSSDNLAAGNHNIKFEVRDAAKKFYVEDVEKLTTADNALTLAGEVGMIGNGAATHDTFVADDVGGGGPAIIEGSAILTGAGALAAVALARSLGTATLAGTGSIVASALALAFGTAALTGSGALAGVGVRIVPGAGTLAGAGSLDADGMALAYASCSMSGAGSISADALAIALASVTMPGSGGLSAAGVRIVSGTGALVGTGSLAADGLTLVLAASAMVGTGAISADGLAIVPASAAMTGSGTLSATGVRIVGGAVLFGAAALSGAGALAASALRLVPSSATLTGSGSLAADAKAIVLASAVMPGAGALSGAAFAIVPATATLTGGGVCGLTAPVAVISGAAVLAGTGDLSADGDAAQLAVVLGAATLTASGWLRAAGIPYVAPGTWGRRRLRRVTLWEMQIRPPRLPSDFRKDPDGTTPWDFP